MLALQIDCLFEPAQEGSPAGFELFEDALEVDDRCRFFSYLNVFIFQEKAEKIAGYLGLEKVGVIYAHPPREEGFELSNAEILFACEQRLEVGKDKPFVVAKVTVDKEGQAAYEAFQVCLIGQLSMRWHYPNNCVQISDQCLEMFEKGALEEHENPK